MKENLIKGVNVGLLLLVSSILTLRFTNDLNGAVKVFNYFIPVALVYIVIGILFQFIRQLPGRNSKGRYIRVYRKRYSSYSKDK